MKKITVLIPALNEERAIQATLHQIPKQELERAGYEVEVLVVDNASTDRTADIARANGATVVYEPVRGYGSAYLAGFAHATGDWVVTGDADMTYPLEMIPTLLDYAEREYIDFLSTNRLREENIGAMARSHYFGNQVLSLVARALYRLPFRDSQSGMWLLRRQIWGSLRVLSKGMAFSQELKIEAFVRGFRCAEMPIPYRARIGKVKLRAIRDGVRNLLHLLRKFMAVRTHLRAVWNKQGSEIEKAPF